MRYMVIYTLQASYEVEAPNEEIARSKADDMYHDEEWAGTITDPVVAVKELGE